MEIKQPTVSHPLVCIQNRRNRSILPGCQMPTNPDCYSYCSLKTFSPLWFLLFFLFVSSSLESFSRPLTSSPRHPAAHTHPVPIIYIQRVDSDLQQLFCVYMRQSPLTFKIKLIIEHQGPFLSSSPPVSTSLHPPLEPITLLQQ